MALCLTMCKGDVLQVGGALVRFYWQSESGNQIKVAVEAPRESCPVVRHGRQSMEELKAVGARLGLWEDTPAKEGEGP